MLGAAAGLDAVRTEMKARAAAADSAWAALGMAIDRSDVHSECERPAGDIRPDRAEADDSHRCLGQEDRGAIHRVDGSGARRKADSGLLAADGLIAPLRLTPDVDVQIPGEGEDVTHHLIGDDVSEEPSHVSEHARVIDQGWKDVVLKAHGERLDPLQLVGFRQHFGLDFTQKRRSTGDRLNRRFGINGVNPRRRRGDALQHFQSLVFDGRMNQVFHEALVRDFDGSIR